MNLLTETSKILQEHDLSLADIRWVSAELYYNDFTTAPVLATRAEFIAAAAGYNHTNSFGYIEVNKSLRVVGDDWWLARHGYDGREWWEFKRESKPPFNFNEIWVEAEPWDPRVLQP